MKSNLLKTSKSYDDIININTNKVCRALFNKNIFKVVALPVIMKVTVNFLNFVDDRCIFCSILIF